MLRNDLFDPSYYEMYIDRLEVPNLRVVVSLSGGASSAVAAQRAIDKYGKGRVELVFADTKIEAPDLYRFLSDLEARWQMTITRLVDGRDPYRVAEDEHIIPNQKLAKCSDRLKVEPMQKHVDALQADGAVIILVLGFDYTDAQPRGDKPQGRLPSPRRNWAKRNVMVWYPLLDKPVELDSKATVRSWGIAVPDAYAKGYSHNNCSGACVKQGKKDWRRTLAYNPVLFGKVEEWELGMIAFSFVRAVSRLRLALMFPRLYKISDINFNVYTLLRDEREGGDGNMTLEQLRLETEAADERQMKMFAFTDDLGAVCGVECVAA